MDNLKKLIPDKHIKKFQEILLENFKKKTKSIEITC